MNSTYFSSGIHGGAVKRIRTPHQHDVLSGRGGGINSHAGNQQFRDWVKVRKNDYNLALSKNDKARVAREVIGLVESQEPPGRFLQKDPSSVGTSSWWVEIDEERVMAKTSQALREGAPSIRAAHKDDMVDGELKPAARRIRKKPTDGSVLTESSGMKRKRDASEAVAKALQLTQQQAMEELRANADAAAQDNGVQSAYEQPGKRVRVDYKGQLVYPSDETPPLLPVVAPRYPESMRGAMLPPPQVFPPMPLSAAQPKPAEGLKRSHSLALSDYSLGEWQEDAFVNPFSDESEMDWKRHAAPKPGISRDASITSNGDMGGIGALMRSESSSKPASSNSSGVRSRNSLANMSSRYDDLKQHWSSTPPFWWDFESAPAPVSPDRETAFYSVC